MQELDNQAGFDWRRPLWVVLLTIASVAFTLGFACATPLAAFCAAAACTLPRRDAYCVAGMVWLANQLVGFTFLHYPWTAECLTWGAVLGLSAFLSTWVARLTVGQMGELHPVARNAAAFLAAFAASEATLFGFSFWLGGLENFTAAIQLRIFAINVGALVALFAIHRVGTLMGIAAPRAALGQ